MTAEYQSCLKPLRERPVGLETETEAQARYERLAPHLQRHAELVFLEHGRRVRRRRQLSWAAAALTGTAGLSVSVWFVLVRPSTLVATDELNKVTLSGELLREDESGRSLVSGVGLELALTGTVTTLSQPARITTQEGLELAFGPGTEASLAELAGVELEGKKSSQVRLRSGSISCRVPPLGAAKEFAVVTPDLRVVVHGTEFSVRVEERESNSGKTCVRVSEGRVAVHRGGGQIMLSAGGSFGCDLPSAELTSKVDENPGTLERKRRAPATTLLEETRLLQSALVAERRGQPERAARLVKDLLGKYPSSPLRDEAREMLERLKDR